MNEKPVKLKDRIVSIDALRGFAMFLILAVEIGGAPIFSTFFNLWDNSFTNAAAEQFSYGPFEGLRFYLTAMPMFIFVVGLVLPLSLNNRSLRKNNVRLYLHIIKRVIVLFILGLIAGGHLLHLKFSNIHIYNNVLEYISISYLVCALLLLNTSRSVQLIITIVLLLGYWLLFLFIPVPGWQGDVLSDQMNLAIYIDNILLGPFHAQGSCRVLTTISFIANMLLGVLMGQIIFSNRDKKSKTRLLFLYGILMLVLGVVWGQFFPIIRTLWTSSFVLITCGISTLLLACFYYLIDVKGYVKWAFFFIVFGVNSIAIYMMAHLFDFSLIGNIFVGGLGRYVPSNVQDFIQAVAAMLVMWLIMFWLYRKKTFIKV
jgi:predicted acyltransferase